MVHSYISKLNRLTELRLQLPPLIKDVRRLEQENVALNYRIDRFESPKSLMRLKQDPRFGYMVFPSLDKVIEIEDPLPRDQK